MLKWLPIEMTYFPYNGGECYHLSFCFSPLTNSKSSRTVISFHFDGFFSSFSSSSRIFIPFCCSHFHAQIEHKTTSFIPIRRLCVAFLSHTNYKYIRFLRSLSLSLGRSQFVGGRTRNFHAFSMRSGFTHLTPNKLVSLWHWIQSVSCCCRWSWADRARERENGD